MTEPLSLPSRELTVSGYAAAVAAASPTPGGGSVCAVALSLAAGLCEMVCGITLGSPRIDVTERERLADAALSSTELRERLLRLATIDEQAYGSYRAAHALPRNSEHEKSFRAGAMEAALVVAAESPLAIARAGSKALEIMITAAELGTRHASSDIATAALLAESSVRAVLLNVEVNAALLTTGETASRLRNEADSVQSAATSTAARVTSILDSR